MGSLPAARELRPGAAAADRSSFGCDYESDFTYFGKAYFDEELRRTYSFIGAFDGARMAIARREKAGGLTPSNPQIHVGAAAKAKLEGVERRLSRGR